MPALAALSYVWFVSRLFRNDSRSRPVSSTTARCGRSASPAPLRIAAYSACGSPNVATISPAAYGWNSASACS